ncbi:MAG: hypothetical protein NTZ42_03130 [Candidatus Gribaldobacteria bacterium]|nr:hypothetical protein [Candidatus Gribaldobacteria bacterium]
MKYNVYAKFLGSYMPNKKVRLGGCTILKSYDQYHLDDDRPVIPVRSKDTEFHCLEHGVKNYIYYPQGLISVRTFESEYLIITEVETHSEYDALKTAVERFLDISSTLSLVAKNKIVKLGKKRIKRGDEFYDFEIIGIFIKKNRQLIRLKLPGPLVNGHNFFPKQFPEGFLSKAKKYLSFRDLIFTKGLVYFQRATAMRESGIFNELEIILNFVKCIELVCWHIGEDDHFGLPKKKFKNLPTKKVIALAGKKIKVTNKTVESAKKLWDARNKGDVAHENLYFNSYSRRSTNAMLNFRDIESDAAEFLVKYYKYREKNPKFYF